ncbi:hypothetical protein PIB30_007851 [Stylosanthes scabra]|uniref:Uncharacterized protein n=1 Tax=Stylosanthes scabra TaxID=79078 RepID=A0ABU6R513_9FABA|nr:hypothetical protein [Stylosanthes scabra]
MNERNFYPKALSTNPSMLGSGHHYYVAEPCRVLNLLDESCLEKALNLFLGFSHFFWTHSPQLLSYRLATMYNGQLVAGKVWIYPRHVSRCPCKEVGILLLELSQLSLQFFRQVFCDHGHFLGLFPYLDLLKIIFRLWSLLHLLLWCSRSTKRHPLAPSGFCSFGTCSLEMCKVALWHFSASCFSPRNTPTFPPSVMNFIVRMEVATTAPILLRVGLPITAL